MCCKPLQQYSKACVLNRVCVSSDGYFDGLCCHCYDVPYSLQPEFYCSHVCKILAAISHVVQMTIKSSTAVTSADVTLCLCQPLLMLTFAHASSFCFSNKMCR